MILSISTKSWRDFAFAQWQKKKKILKGGEV